jgi:hypothetical protein
LLKKEAKMLKVVSYSVGGKGNKIYFSGAIVSENNFENVEELIKKGFLEPLKAAPKIKEVVVEEVDVKTPKAYADITVNELKEILVTFPEKAKKPELYDLYLSTFE